MNAEQQRLNRNYAGEERWEFLGPYLSERAWGTVREDYSADGNAWSYFPHDHARSRVYRWGEDGLAGISDDKQRLCFALALWNGQDPILKERLFGMDGNQAIHGEDVKEYYYYLDSTPTHSYMKWLYKYPQRAYPYQWLVEENSFARRTRHDFEFELVDTGIFAENRYFDVMVEYAKASPADLLIRINVTNRGPEAAPLHLLPTLWFRNTWVWGYNDYKPALGARGQGPEVGEGSAADTPTPQQRTGNSEPETRNFPTPNPQPPTPVIRAQHDIAGEFWLHCEGADELLFTENETNQQRLYGVPNHTPYVKDGINDYIVYGKREAVNPAQTGTKAAAHYFRTIEAGETVTLRLRLTRQENGVPIPVADYRVRRNPTSSAPSPNGQTSTSQVVLQKPSTQPVEPAVPVPSQLNLQASASATSTTSPTQTAVNPHPSSFIPHPFFEDFEQVFAQRIQEADEFYKELQPQSLTDEEKMVQRQAFAGMLWSKQFYYYVVDQWLKGDPAMPPPPESRKGKHARNTEWRHLYNERVMSMPDKWEYPWYASWDLGFHCIVLALIDSEFAKCQLDLLMREWYQHPNGGLPAYEWAFGDSNPPVLAWATWRVYKIEEKQRQQEGGTADRAFLESIFHKLLMNFTWWVNRKDSGGNNIFEGGFLGLDNIGVFDRSNLPSRFRDGSLEQSDATSWMGMFCLNMMRMALELARENPVYEDIATKFFEHFLSIAEAMNNVGGESLWDEDDHFFYDILSFPDGHFEKMRVRSLVGLIPLLAVEVLDAELLDAMPSFKLRLEWYLTNKKEVADLVSRFNQPGQEDRRLLALVRKHRMVSLLRRMLDPNEFLSDYGVRSVSKYHQEHPFVLDQQEGYSIDYEPAESQTGMFGGNSNWRGPVWFPINYLLIEALQSFHHYYGGEDEDKVECPTGSGKFLTLDEVADELSNRLIRLFLRNENEQGRRPFNGGVEYFQTDPHWRDLILFYEYFHGDNGAGIGASHQTGWTGLVAKLLQQQGEKRG